MGLLMNAIVLVDKPAGISSAEVVRRVKSRVKPARVGHLGTLDPFATGLLPIMIGEATKLAPFIDGGDKTYAGLIRLGVETDTLDRDGAEVRRADVPDITAEKLAQVAAQFTARSSRSLLCIPRSSAPAFRSIGSRAAATMCPAREAQRRDQAPRSHQRSARRDSIRRDMLAWHLRALAGARHRRRIGTVAHLENSAAPATAHSRSPTRCRWQTSSHRLIPTRRFSA